MVLQRWMMALGVALLVAGAGGCSGLDPKPFEAQVERVEREFTPVEPAGPGAAVTRSSGVWLAGRVIPIAEPEPEVLAAPVKLASAAPMSLRHIVTRMTQVTGTPVVLTPDVFAPPDCSGGDGCAGASGLDASRDRIEINYSGPLRGLLDEVTTRYGLAWRHEDGRVLVSRLVTRVFELHVLPGRTEVEASVGGKAKASEKAVGAITVGSALGGAAPTSGGGSSGGGSSDVSQGMTRSMSLSHWDSVMEMVQSMLSPVGRVAGSASSGVLTVTDTPESVSRVARYVEAENARATRQVALYVRVLSLDREDSSSFGLNLEGLLNTSGVSASLLTPDLVTGAAGTLSLNLLRSSLADSRAVLDAIANRVRGSSVTSASVVTLNGHPAPIQVTRTEGFLRQVSTTVVPDGGATTSLVPGQVTTGFLMTVTPRVIGENRIVLSYMVDLSSLIGFVTEASGGQSIRVPNLDERSFSQSVAVRSGDVLVISGFEREAGRIERGGMGSADNALLGGRNAERSEGRLLVLMTPVLVGDGSAAAL